MNPALLVLLPVLIINILAKGVESTQDAAKAYQEHRVYLKAHPGPKKKKAIHPPKWGKRSIERFFATYDFMDGEWIKKSEVKP